MGRIDEMICGTLVSDAVKFMLEICGDFVLDDQTEDHHLPEEEIIEKYGTQQNLAFTRWRDIPMLFPFKLLVVLLMTCIYVIDYYADHCDFSEEGWLVSKNVHRPKT